MPKFSAVLPEGMHYLCGINFWPYPGKYPLPNF